MTAIRIEEQWTKAAVGFLQHCYRFTNEDWQHVNRLDLPDQGYESIFRISCVTQLNGWEISEHREMRFGHEANTASGILHEIDIAARHPECNAIMELKNRQDPPAKNDIILLFAKLLDYLTQNPVLTLKEMCPIFMSTTAFEVHGLAACLGLGIHAVSPGLRPVPLLVDNSKRMEYEIIQGLEVSDETQERFGDYCAELNSLCLSLSDSWLGSRFGYRSEDTLVLKAAPASDSMGASHMLRHLNTECNWLLSSLREAKR